MGLYFLLGSGEVSGELGGDSHADALETVAFALYGASADAQYSKHSAELISNHRSRSIYTFNALIERILARRGES